VAAAWRPTSRTKRFVCDAERSTGAITLGSHSPSSPLHPSTTRSNAFSPVSRHFQPAPPSELPRSARLAAALPLRRSPAGRSVPSTVL